MCVCIFVRTSSNRFCRSGIDFVLTAGVVPVVFDVDVVVAPLPDAAADPEAFDGDNDEAGGVAAAAVPVAAV